MSQVKVSIIHVIEVANAMLLLKERQRKESKEKAIAEEMLPCWWRGPRTREKAIEVLHKRASGTIFGPEWLYIGVGSDSQAEKLIKACQESHDEFILLTISEAAQLRDWENELKYNA